MNQKEKKDRDVAKTTNQRRLGRPRLSPEVVKIPVGYKLPRWLVRWIRSREESAAYLIETSLCEVYGLKKPGEEGQKND